MSIQTEYKQKDEVPDLYNFLGLTIDVCKDPNCDEIIKKAYVKKVIICHPDKHPNRDKKELEDLFNLLTYTYDILKDEKQRTEYNHKLSLKKQSTQDFFKLKKSAADYASTLGEYKPPTDQQNISFKDQMKILDSKHGFDSGMTSVISKHDARKKMTQINRDRAEQDRFLPEKIFDGDRFDLRKFNEAFDKTHNKTDDAIIQHTGAPSAWNDLNGTVSYSAFDNLDNLYVDDKDRIDVSHQIYGSSDFGAPPTKITKDEVEKLTGADYVTSHNYLDDDYYKNMKNRLKEREGDSSKFEKMAYTDFKRDDTAGYGIFDKLGYKFDEKLALDIDEEEISKKYDKIMNGRKTDIDFVKSSNKKSR